MEPIQEIAKTLRCTDRMAEAFVQSVREKIGQDAPDEVILAAVQRLPPRSISLTKVVAGVRQELNKRSRGPARRRPALTVRSATGGAPVKPVREELDGATEARRPSSELRASRRPAPGGTLLDVLEGVLSANWSRAEQEGFSPERFSGADFIRAVHLHCHPRDATRPRIVKACQKIDRQDVIITPTLVADIIREEA